MAELRNMPPLAVDQGELEGWGQTWSIASRFGGAQSTDFGYVFDKAFAVGLAEMLGGIPIVRPRRGSLVPPQPDCVEVGPARIIGGIRPQNFDVAYRPDGPRIVFDSKTLNEADSIRKNWQNMVNDLATEATTVHTRFPYCLVAFTFVMPAPAAADVQKRSILRTLERLGSRKDELDENHLAEAISLVLWDPATGTIDPDYPEQGSKLRFETMNERVQAHYEDRYKGLPPHDRS